MLRAVYPLDRWYSDRFVNANAHSGSGSGGDAADAEANTLPCKAEWRAYRTCVRAHIGAVGLSDTLNTINRDKDFHSDLPLPHGAATTAGLKADAAAAAVADDDDD